MTPSTTPDPGNHADVPGGDVAAELLSGLALASFRLNGQFLHVAEELAKPAGMTAAWWQVLGAVLGEPLPVAGIARVMGMTRQGVQRIADLLVERGLAEYRPNPAHRRAKLLQPTDAGREAIAGIVPGHRDFAARLVEVLGLDATRDALTALHHLTAALTHLTDA
ncbi:MarR family winged helix-turn-helix transcriptional regulator [Nonomuraea sp. NPDC047529]|uniref:MarR family winged helix-turn-helix transcriptional regulator n=1 Tax=Nonomuraea sp. NPDC047529 TaxID=3155623 RepID=UPI0033D0D44C